MLSTRTYEKYSVTTWSYLVYEIVWKKANHLKRCPYRLTGSIFVDGPLGPTTDQKQSSTNDPITTTVRYLSDQKSSSTTVILERRSLTRGDEVMARRKADLSITSERESVHCCTRRHWGLQFPYHCNYL